MKKFAANPRKQGQWPARPACCPTFRRSVLTLGLFLWASFGSAGAEPPGENFFWYINEYPFDASPGFSGDLNGVAHDENHWFFTQEHALWKIPVGLDLEGASLGDMGVLRVLLDDLPQLAGYNHFGDLEHYEFAGQGYLLVPLETDGKPAILAIFRGSDLSYLAHTNLSQQQDSNAGWCAVDAEGLVYTSRSDTSEVLVYHLDWRAFHEQGVLNVTSTGAVTLRDEFGNPLTEPIRETQGGVISPRERLLYLSAGLNDQRRASDGIHVFELSSGKRIQRSTLGPGYFHFLFVPGWFLLDSEEAEGLTIWDLDDGRAPGIGGQLHAIILANEVSDDIYIAHYRRFPYQTIWVDPVYSGVPWGTEIEPFRTVLEAYNVAGPGAEIRLRAGWYAEGPLTFSKSCTLVAEGGAAIIGN